MITQILDLTDMNWNNLSNSAIMDEKKTVFYPGSRINCLPLSQII